MLYVIYSVFHEICTILHFPLWNNFNKSTRRARTSAKTDSNDFQNLMWTSLSKGSFHIRKVASDRRYDRRTCEREVLGQFPAEDILVQRKFPSPKGGVGSTWQSSDLRSKGRGSISSRELLRSNYGQNIHTSHQTASFSIDLKAVMPYGWEVTAGLAGSNAILPPGAC